MTSTQIENQTRAVKKHTKQVKRLCKELGRRQPGGKNWQKTRAKLKRYLGRLKGAIQAYYGAGGTHCPMIDKADAAQQMGWEALGGDDRQDPH